jgi:hypothetical protein
MKIVEKLFGESDACLSASFQTLSVATVSYMVDMKRGIGHHPVTSVTKQHRSRINAVEAN